MIFCIYSFHRKIKEVLGKDKGLAKVIAGLIKIAIIRLNERQMMLRIREVKFPRQRRKKFAASISPFAWLKITEIMK
jgi:hypothetical protein